MTNETQEIRCRTIMQNTKRALSVICIRIGQDFRRELYISYVRNKYTIVHIKCAISQP